MGQRRKQGGQLGAPAVLQAEPGPNEGGRLGRAGGLRPRAGRIRDLVPPAPG